MSAAPSDPLERIKARAAELAAEREAERAAVVRAWVARSCAEQGVPFYVSDPDTLANVVVLLRTARPEGADDARG